MSYEPTRCRPAGSAEALGITQAYLSYRERGERTLGAERLSRIAAALKCQTADLMNAKRRLA